MFSVLDMLEWEWPEDNDPSALTANLKFENTANEPCVLLNDEIAALQTRLSGAFDAYVKALESTAQNDKSK